MTDQSSDTAAASETTRTTDDPAAEPSLGQLFGDLGREFSELMRKEVQLAKTELREEAGKAGKAAGQLTAAAITGLLCVLLLSLAAAWGLGEVMPIAVGLLIVAVIHGIAAAVLYRQGRARAKQIEPVPTETVETLQEDAQWAKQQLT